MAATTDIKKILSLLILLCFLSSCFSRSAAMTNETYSMIEIGTAEADLRNEAGSPYAVHDKPNGVKEFEYIERIRNDRALFSENHYIFSMQDGRVVSKRMWQEKPRSFNMIYDFDPNYDSYNSFPGSFP